MGRRLVLYSDQMAPVTDGIDARMFSMLPENPTIGYLPASADRERSWFRRQEAYYGRYGATLEFFGVEDEFVPGRVDRLFACDAIHMTGGNTFQFLYWLRKRGLMEPLREFGLGGGVLVGVSAGAILVTPTIETSLLCGDPLYPGLRDFAGLGLVDFAVAPHAREVGSFDFDGVVYWVPDGAGIVVDGDAVELFGDVRHTGVGFPPP